MVTTMNRKSTGRWTVTFLLAALGVIGGAATLPATAMPKHEVSAAAAQVAKTPAQIRAHIVAVARWQLTHSRPYKVNGKTYNSVPNLKGHYNYLGRSGSNENRNIYTRYASREWCGDFARFVWTSGGTEKAPVPAGASSSQNWRTGVGSRWHAYSNSTLPQPGDVLVWTNRKNSGKGHVAVVTAVNKTKRAISYIAGNEAIAGNSDSIVQHSDYWSKMRSSMDGKTFRGFASRF
jgi:surface antigen